MIASDPSFLEIGRVLRDRYVLEERLGSGGRSTVFKALDRYRTDLPEAQQYVAVKIFHATIDNSGKLPAKLRHEFYAAQTLSHRNIVNVFELDQDDDVDFFTMEFLDGELLSSVMERLRPLPMSRPQAWAIIREIGAGIEHAHARNILHTDLKPHNIMIMHSGEVRILDFGTSSASAVESPEDRQRPRRPAAVTPAYACCELLEGRPADPRDDIYALACLAYELLAGTHPFQRRRSTEARDLGIAPQRPPELSRQQWRALAMGLSWHRGGRSISVSAWLEKLNAGRMAERQLSRRRDLKSAPLDRRPASPFTATALFAVLLITVAFWVAVAHLARIGKLGGDDAIPTVALGGKSGTDSVAPAKDAVPAGNPVAAATAVEADPPVEAARDAPPTAPQTRSPIMVAASDYRVHSGEHFAEIRVRRSTRSGGGTPFVWWTEAASAKPGIDYVPQAKVMQSFPKGKNSTSFFVKLVPNASRAQPEVFYVVIAEARRASSLGRVSRATVWLPPNEEHSSAVAARNDTGMVGGGGDIEPMTHPTASN